ncbi:MAG: hypothetical protein AAF902_09895 [Chloroflexota bacterium]
MKKLVGNGRLTFLLAAILFVFMASACVGGPSSVSLDDHDLNASALYSADAEIVVEEAAEDLTLVEAELETESVLEEVEIDDVLTAENIASVTIGSIYGWLDWVFSFGRFWAG